MSISFSAMMLSSMLVMKQLGFIFAASILVDTFIIRTMVVPSLLHLFGEMNWWPRKYKTEVDDYDNYKEIQKDQLPLLENMNQNED